ncbi:MAG: fibronectin type III domain-containing protein, partial [Acidimicrobiales bacterium]|nr:fibronectin type III domain-containing protein [Acidimicrobiales bacterium]
MTDSSELTESARADGVTTPLKRFARRLVNFKENPENKKSRFLAILLLLVGIVAIIVLTTTGGDNSDSSDSSDATVSSNLQIGLISSQATVPLPPASAFAIPRDGEVDVFWSGPSQNGGAPIVAYSVTVSGTNTETCSTSQLGCTVTGLTNGTAYAFAIVAINTVGASANPIVTEPVTPSADAGQADLEGLTVPDAPTNVTGVAGDGQVTINWSGPGSNGGASITSYTVTETSGEGSSCRIKALSCTITGLTNGTAYTFTVVATNDVGSSQPSDVTQPVTPSADAELADLENVTVIVPDAPTNVIGVAGNGQVTINWSGPGANGGAPITSYTVTGTGGEGATCQVNVLSCTITGLTNGTAYTFTVVATNAVGDSQPSAATGQIVPTAAAPPGNVLINDQNVQIAAPEAPTNLAGVAGNGQIAISWNPPARDGGSPITTYTVAATTAGNDTICVVAVLQCTITGLTNGAAYTFTVFATNAAGDSLFSNVGGPVIPTAVIVPPAPLPITAPAAPTNVTAVPGNGQATVNWSGPGANGGSPITGYTVTSIPAGVGQTCTVTATTCTVTGLTNGNAYSFVVVATNIVGNSQLSNPSAQVIPVGVVIPPAPLPAGVTVPDAPTNLVGVAGNGQVTLVWAGPANNGGSVITGYTVTRTPGGVGETCVVTVPTCTFTTLENGTAYTFTVVATNAAGNSANSIASAALIPIGQQVGNNAAPTAPFEPTRVIATPLDKRIQVDWLAPVNDGGSAITGYTVTRTPGGEGQTCELNALTCTFTNLQNGTAYTFTVVATNDIGDGQRSVPSAPVAPVGVPNPPTNLAGFAGNGQVTLVWAPPVNDGGSVITGYTVTRTPGGEGQTCELNALTCTFTNLENGTAYTFTVVATNAAGNSGNSIASEAFTPLAGGPGAPTNIRVVSNRSCEGLPYENDLMASQNLVTGQQMYLQHSYCGNRDTRDTATISWDAPADTGGSPLIGYLAFKIDGPGPEDACGGPVEGRQSCTVDVVPGQRYSFSVFAFSEPTPGQIVGTDSVEVDFVAQAAPASDFEVTLIPGDGNIRVNWDAAKQSGTNVIHSYEFYAVPARDQQVVQSVGVAELPQCVFDKNCTTSPPSKGVEFCFTLVSGKGNLSCTIDGLINGVTYYVQGRALSFPADSPLNRDAAAVKFDLDALVAELVDGGGRYLNTYQGLDFDRAGSPWGNPDQLVTPVSGATVPNAPSRVQGGNLWNAEQYIITWEGNLYAVWNSPSTDGGARVESYRLEYFGLGERLARRVSLGTLEVDNYNPPLGCDGPTGPQGCNVILDHYDADYILYIGRKDMRDAVDLGNIYTERMFLLTARNSEGESSPLVSRLTDPGVPTNLTATLGDVYEDPNEPGRFLYNVSYSWSAPDNNGLPINDYAEVLRISENDLDNLGTEFSLDRCWGMRGLPALSNCNDTLETGIIWEYGVAAINEAGQGDYSEFITLFKETPTPEDEPTATAPSAPRITRVVATDEDPLGTVVFVYYDTPDDIGGSSITG